MDSETVKEEIKRLKALYGGPRSQAEQAQWDALIAELERKFLHLKQEEVKRTIDYVIEKKKTKGIPLFSEFVAAIAALRHVGRITAAPCCHDCGGSGLATRMFTVKETGELIRGCVPCPICRRFQYETWEIKPTLELAVEEGLVSDPILRARALSPGAARAAIEMIEQYKFLSSVPEPLINELVKKASEGEL